MAPYGQGTNLKYCNLFLRYLFLTTMAPYGQGANLKYCNLSLFSPFLTTIAPYGQWGNLKYCNLSLLYPFLTTTAPCGQWANLNYCTVVPLLRGPLVRGHPFWEDSFACKFLVSYENLVKGHPSCKDRGQQILLKFTQFTPFGRTVLMKSFMFHSLSVNLTGYFTRYWLIHKWYLKTYHKCHCKYCI